jgi:hypothetical protein
LIRGPPKLATNNPHPQPLNVRNPFAQPTLAKQQLLDEASEPSISIHANFRAESTGRHGTERTDPRIWPQRHSDFIFRPRVARAQERQLFVVRVQLDR